MRKKKVIPPTIYVQIAAYRDPELLPTLKDCLDKAQYPENLRFGVAWQHSEEDEWDNLNDYINDNRFKIIDINYKDAAGPCVARYKLNKMYSGEKYALQLDSHHRFAENWDTILIDMLESLRSKDCKKPVLSSYLPSYDPSNDPEARLLAPWTMEFDRFAPEGPVHFLPHTIDDYLKRDKPVPARFISGHFIFADGIFCKEVEYDPEYYFHGEEINLSVRSYMAGYNVFAPHKSVIWHEYTRRGKVKHWDDHSNWAELNDKSYSHNRNILGIGESNNEKMLDKLVRTLYDYEKYAGLEFSTKRVHKDTLEKKIPPVSLDDISHKSGLVNFHRICIDIYKGEFTEKDYNVFAVAFENEDGVEFFRQDAFGDELTQLLDVPYETDKFVHIWRNFYSDKPPVKWIVWPHSESKGWMKRLTGEIKYG
jgi:hypothetical protein